MYKFVPLLVIFIIFGFGCSGISTEQQQSLRPVTLNYWTVYNDVNQMRQFAREYQSIHPHITVNVRQVRYEEFDRLFTNALADDVGPDIISVHSRWIYKYQNRLSPMPQSVQVPRLIQKSKLSNDVDVVTETFGLPSVSNIRSNYVRAIADDVIIGQNAYGLPIAFDTLALYYNKDLLDKAGVPEPPRTWGEFIEAVKETTVFDNQGRIAQAGTALGTGANNENAFDIVSLLMRQSGVEMVSGARAAFNIGVSNATHPLYKALDFYTDFARPDKESYSWNDEQGSAFDAFVRGKVVMYFGNAYEYGRIKARAPEMNIGIISVPQLNESAPVNIANYWVESVVGKSKHINEAWDFVRFVAGADNVARYTAAAFRPTPLRSQIRAQEENPDMLPFVSQALFAENWYHGNNIDRVSAAFEDLVDRYKEPAASDKEKLKRNGDLINAAARIVESTL